MVSFFFNTLRQIFLLFTSTKRQHQPPFNFIFLKFNFHDVVTATCILWSCIWLCMLSQQGHMYMLLLKAHRGSQCPFSLCSRSQVAVLVHGTADFLSIFCLKGIYSHKIHATATSLDTGFVCLGSGWTVARSEQRQNHAELHTIQSSAALDVCDSVFTT